MRRRPLWLAVAAACTSLQAQALDKTPIDTQNDLSSMPLEQLLSMEVYSASKFVQRASQAPSSVTVITAAEIRDFGWRTLADVARSVRGLYVNYDRSYSLLGSRGFLRPGDFNTHFLLQVDGNRINNSVYGQAPLGGEFPLDLELVDRIEFVPGPGSSIYGSNAFFGVINVITKKGGDAEGARAGVEVGGAGWRRANASYGWHGADGAQYLLSASRLASRGRDLYSAEYDTPEQNHGVAENLDYERVTRLFGSASLAGASVSLMHSARTKGTPTAAWEQAFNDPRSRLVDRQSTLNASFRTQPGEHEELSTRVFAGRYQYFGVYPYERGEAAVNRDDTEARWWGAELNLLSTRWAGHTLLAGMDLQRDYRLAQRNYDTDPLIGYLDDHRQSRSAGVYMQDEMALSDALRVSLGLRYDHSSSVRGGFSPRAALVWQATSATTLKVIHGTAFRAPNAYELYYEFLGDGGQLANPELARERIRSSEVALSHLVGPSARITATLFNNKAQGLITQLISEEHGEHGEEALPRFENMHHLCARGAELEYEQAWAGGASLRASYSWSETRSDEHQQINAPRHLAKLNAAVPLPLAGTRAGLELQYVGPRRTLSGATGGYWLANANLLSARVRDLDVALTVYNLFDRRYADPGSTEHLQSAIAQDGRRLRLRVGYAF